MNLSALLVVAAYMHLYFFKQIPCGSVNLRAIVIVDFKLRPFQLSHFLPYFRFTKLADFKWTNLMKLQNEQGNHSSSLFISLFLSLPFFSFSLLPYLLTFSFIICSSAPITINYKTIWCVLCAKITILNSFWMGSLCACCVTMMMWVVNDFYIAHTLLNALNNYCCAIKCWKSGVEVWENWSDKNVSETFYKKRQKRLFSARFNTTIQSQLPLFILWLFNKLCSCTKWRL